MPENTDDPAHRREPPEASPEPLPIPAAVGEDAGEDDVGLEGDFSKLLKSFDDAADLDDQVASDLDAGVAVSEAPLMPDDSDPAPLDVGEIVDAPVEAKNLVAEGDEFGPSEDPGGSDAVETLPDGGEGDDGDGVLDGEVEPPELGSLDWEEDDEEVTKGPLEELGVVLDEEPPGLSPLPWLAVPIPAGPRRRLLVSSRGRVLTANEDIASVDDAGAITTLVTERAGPIASMLVTPDGSIFYTTLGGELFRVDSRGRERISAWTDVFGLEQPAYALELGGMTPSSRPAILLRVGGKRNELLESTDYGTTFRRVDLGGQVLTVSSGAPPVAVVRGERSIRVLRSEPTGGFSVACASFRTTGDAPIVAVHGDVVAALDPGRGVQVSADAGRSFRFVEGSGRATAIEAGIVAGRPTVFSALFDAAAESSKIACVDAASAEAVVVAGIEAGDDASDDFARIVSLAWNEHTEALWCAGAFGLRCWRRPPSA